VLEEVKEPDSGDEKKLLKKAKDKKDKTELEKEQKEI
jgi:hypothetical protein